MPKLKDWLPSFFGNSKETTKVTANVGKLEFDAVPVAEDDSEILATNANNTPTVSTELTESVVNELSDPNYNSLVNTRDTLVTNQNDSNATSTYVHNAQQQVVMQFTNANNLHFGSVYNFNSNISTSSNTSRKNSGTMDESAVVPNNTAECSGKPTAQQYVKPRKTKSIALMMRDPEEPSHRILDTIATHLGDGWKSVMRDLGHSTGQIDQAFIDHQLHGGVKEVIYQLLLQWLRNADDDTATIGFITTLLWETNHRDCVERMKEVWKSEAVRKKLESQNG